MSSNEANGGQAVVVLVQPQKSGGCCGSNPESEQYCCNWSTTEHQVMNSRYIFDVVAIVITLMSGVGFFMLSGLLGSNSALSFWLMVIYTLFTSILLCNCCNCSQSAKKVFGYIDIIMRFFTIIFTGLAIQDLKDFKEKYLDSDDAFAVAVEEVVDAAITRIVITLVLQILCFGMTAWWIFELRRKIHSHGAVAATSSVVELAPPALKSEP